MMMMMVMMMMEAVAERDTGVSRGRLSGGHLASLFYPNRANILCGEAGAPYSPELFLCFLLASISVLPFWTFFLMLR
jgi:hypothetical protein